jgi:hypothetical protein
MIKQGLVNPYSLVEVYLFARLDRLEESSFKSREEEVKAKISRFIEEKVAE